MEGNSMLREEREGGYRHSKALPRKSIDEKIFIDNKKDGG